MGDASRKKEPYYERQTQIIPVIGQNRLLEGEKKINDFEIAREVTERDSEIRTSQLKELIGIMNNRIIQSYDDEKLREAEKILKEIFLILQETNHGVKERINKIEVLLGLK